LRGPIESPTPIGFTSAVIGSVIGRCAATDRPTKITFADCTTKAFAVYNCRWPDDARLSDIEPRFICKGLRQSRR